MSPFLNMTSSWLCEETKLRENCVWHFHWVFWNQTTESSHPSSLLMSFTSTLLLPAGTYTNRARNDVLLVEKVKYECPFLLAHIQTLHCQIFNRKQGSVLKWQFGQKLLPTWWVINLLDKCSCVQRSLHWLQPGNPPVQSETKKEYLRVCGDKLHI